MLASPVIQDTFDLKKAQEILDRDHYGLADIKVPMGSIMGSQGKMEIHWDVHLVKGSIGILWNQWEAKEGLENVGKCWKRSERIGISEERINILSARFWDQNADPVSLLMYHVGARPKFRKRTQNQE